MNLTVHGTGYVGLVTGACIADTGNNVLCVDVDADKIARLKKGEVPIYEPGLNEIVRRNLADGRLRFTTDIAEGVNFGLLQFIAVGTPPDEDGSADMQYVLAVANSIGAEMDDYKLIVNKSTVPVGTADKVQATVAEQLASRGVDIDFNVASNPEFLKEGAAVPDFTKPDRIIIGTDSEKARELLRALYEPFNRNHERIFFLDIRSAELTKYAANAMLATKISFINELANLAEKLGADIEQVRVGIGSDPRIGYEFIYPGCGFGGSCFPKDVRALVRAAGEQGYKAELVEAVERVNNRQKEALFTKLLRHFGNKIEGKTVALWGLAFKPNTDDMREAPSRTFMEACWEAGVNVRAYDPVARDETARIYGKRADLSLCESAVDALDGADALVIATEWREFRSPDFARICSSLSEPVIIDGRNIFDPAQMQALGIRYYAIGRGD
ncbi:MAG: UDP-glucose/GDP-mannose dehydrogenase family protein [Gammaproteobacteria bacterium]|jgi:UDPglucose 6-dehydrogenase|nr:UDP-glucose 6-dehydrogenase [Chromatiales bacterium]MDP7093345.1 UDP-glucose/GDP-mannose dehydrogenase family protein [Gammaproteobacteria bacterium]MDP7270002.1 UDP-glucose/GDP-mannose dehydrogenase family protein [Gammaproteobacteria bacterium]MDP7661002.1 UDP-glucose/GDP-mannose dehydrogenase family protein [Gammaproteobacteria bacterium]HJP03770.1 UDP-glucose/GDP-mannose dehydrogenase family protein [Gammaproteobacteria bacterium]